MIRNLPLSDMAATIARQHGDSGAIIISVGQDHTRIGFADLSGRQMLDALCLAIRDAVAQCEREG